ncbi:zinc-binding alcohol dehydrogenase family protein [Reinekea blandensis]|uniref:Zinc-type alcohol dehydrogenase-like protein n=1 Tax=Reinekea blandensis MED297 TaxID=314283 RepID=A4BFD9_9GAMM|nr:zinc-binding alcohol dehydrogenase family protein [Reinekea blandensis]EAR09252.1 oxidoreductase, zinc-binding protein [Reinekea sp. MED297] [Reinekea blandensis MED297]
MKAIGYTESLDIQNPNALQDLDLPKPVAQGRDLLIQVKAIAVNPVDTKIRRRRAGTEDEPVVLGWDAVGEVVAVGEDVTLFEIGDQVYYAGDLNRQGTNAEFQRVDERIVGHKPKTLSPAEAAALPLTSITAYEMLFEHLQLQKQTPETKTTTQEVLLVVGAAGGVGSILLQLAKALTGATVIATASRPESVDWVRQLGADYVLDHTQPLAEQMAELTQKEGLGSLTHVASLNATDAYFDSYIEMLAPFGRIALIDDPQQPLNYMAMKPKSLSLHIEFMYARSMFQAVDMIEQHHLLNHVAELIDQGYVKTTLGKHLGTINATNLRAAHAELEAGSAIGKLVLEGF